MTYNNTTAATEFVPCPYIGHYNTIAAILHLVLSVAK